MKRMLSSAVILLMFVLGCSNQEDSISGPANNSLEKEPAVASVSQSINGAEGGLITLSKSCTDRLGRLMSVEATLFFPQGSFNGIKIITMSADFSDGSIEFFPSMQFDKWLSLNIWYRDLPLSEMGYNSNSKVDFVYFGDDGNIYPIVSKSVSVNYIQGSLKVNNAFLNHFSRYGFIRNSE